MISEEDAQELHRWQVLYHAVLKNKLGNAPLTATVIKSYHKKQNGYWSVLLRYGKRYVTRWSWGSPRKEVSLAVAKQQEDWTKGSSYYQDFELCARNRHLWCLEREGMTYWRSLMNKWKAQREGGPTHPNGTPWQYVSHWPIGDKE